MTAARKDLVRRAYNKLKTGDCATLDDLAKHYNPLNHPDVQNGSSTAEELYKHFLSLWPAQKPSDYVTLTQFEDFYYSYSAVCKSDAEFAAILHNEWRL